ncbi:MAG: aminotransferase class I/II-fold pyridoxal phosphate-dependent enzyme, partial [Chloroflexi bacterium]|nr:aminotransferase class I/II-fold pyridoxal phosphate-dependent enzyme [Chloroflexota bacterium]
MATLSARSAHMTVSPIRQVMDLAESLEGVIRLEVGEPDFSTPEPIVHAAQRALDEGWTKYTATAGIGPLRQAIARYESPKVGRELVGSREICVAIGGTNALYLTFLGLLNPGDEVLVPDPGWPQYQNIIRLIGGVPVPYVLDAANEFQVDRDSVVAGLSPRTKAILINSPANPTGSVLGTDDLSFFAQLAQERDLWIVSDEVYDRIIFDGLTHHSIAALSGMAERTV